MPNHSVVWDHSQCDDDMPDPDDNWCSPTGTIVCNAPTDACHLRCDDKMCADGWWMCDDGQCENNIREWVEASYDGEPLEIPVHPDVIHCYYGHPIRVADECNVESIEDVAESFVGARLLTDFHDGPINVQWDGDFYELSYAEANELTC